METICQIVFKRMSDSLVGVGVGGGGSTTSNTPVFCQVCQVSSLDHCFLSSTPFSFILRLRMHISNIEEYLCIFCLSPHLSHWICSSFLSCHFLCCQRWYKLSAPSQRSTAVCGEHTWHPPSISSDLQSLTELWGCKQCQCLRWWLILYISLCWDVSARAWLLI